MCRDGFYFVSVNRGLVWGHNRLAGSVNQTFDNEANEVRGHDPNTRTL